MLKPRLFHHGRKSIRFAATIAVVFGAIASIGSAQDQAVFQASGLGGAERETIARFVRVYCVECHNAEEKTGGLDLDSIDPEALDRHANVWEKVVRKVVARHMPPVEAIRPKRREYDTFIAALTSALDRSAAECPDPGRTDTFRRLNRTEYQNAVRDLLALDIDASALLPADESSHGFDNVTVGDLTPTSLERYITAARTIAKLAVGTRGKSPGGETIRIRPDLTQEEHVEGLPLGTRGGALIPYTFPRDGDYDIEIRLARDRNEHVEGLTEPHEVVVLIDRAEVARFTVNPPKAEKDHATADAGLKARTSVKAGPHKIGVTFLKNPSSLLETKRQPYQAHYNFHRHPRLTPALYQASITGPYNDSGPGDTPSRRRIFVEYPKTTGEEDDCAKRIVLNLARRAYRRDVSDDDLRTPLSFYRKARNESGGDFEAGIESALSALLVNPNFLFRIEADPPGIAPRTSYRIGDFELASRLSFFIWSGIPDDELLDLASRRELSKPEVLERQVRRMLADRRSSSLVSNFASQWLHLRNLESITPDLRLFPDFDDNLRSAFRRETELMFESVIHEDLSVLTLLKTDHTFLNERSARHYAIPHVYGDRFRSVEVGGALGRGGLLRQGSVLTATSYATRTSPVIRGKWVLENLLGSPPPPPPANVPALKDNTVSSSLSVRERLAEHRRDIACSGCHRLMDPVGFTLENFDAVGRYRSFEEGKRVDASGGLPDGSEFEGVDGLETALLKRPEIFVNTLTEKLLTFALGRGVEYYDAPAIRKIVRGASADRYRFSSLIVGIAASTPFQMRRSE
jgi:hypothetical protein